MSFTISRDNNPIATQMPRRYRPLMPFITQNNNRSMSSAATIRRGYLFNSTSPFVGLQFRKMAALFRKSSGSPTGNLTFTVRDSGDTITNTLATFNVAIDLLTGQYKWLFAEFGPVTIPSGGRVLVEYSGGDGSNNIVHGRNTTFGSSLHQDTDFVASYTQSSSATPCIVLFT